MKKLPCITLGLLLLGAVAGAQVDPKPAPSTSAKDLKSLVMALGAKDFATRERADADIRALGKKVVEDLKPYLQHEDAETRMRVKAIIESYDEKPRAAESETEELEPLRLIDPDQADDDRDRRAPRPSEFDSPRDFREALREFMDRQHEDLGRGRVFGGQSILLGPGSGNFQSSKTIYQNGDRLTYAQGSDGIIFTVEPRGGTKSSYEAESLEAFKKNEPEVYERYKSTGIFEESVFHFDVLRPDAAQSELSEREKATQDRLRRLLDLTDRDAFADFDEQMRDMIRRQRELDRSLRERLQTLFERDGVSIELFPGAEQLRRDQANRLNRSSAKPRLGILVGSPPADVAMKLDPTVLGAAGVYVSEVEPGSLAASMGMKVGDVLLRLNTTALNEPGDLVASFQALEPGAKVSIGLVRGTENLNLSGIKPGQRKARAAEAPKKLEKLSDRKAEGQATELKKIEGPAIEIDKDDLKDF